MILYHFHGTFRLYHFMMIVDIASLTRLTQIIVLTLRASKAEPCCRITSITDPGAAEKFFSDDCLTNVFAVCEVAGVGGIVKQA